MLHSRAIAMALLAMILAIDAVRGQVTSYLWFGVLDEVCHLATAVVLLDAAARWRTRRTPRRFLLGALLGSVLIDIDHVPMDLFSLDVITAGTPRPYSHSLATVLVLAVAAGLLRRRRGATTLAGAATGVGLHLLRDAATAPIALWWPVTASGLQVGYGWYAAGLAVATIAGALARGGCDTRAGS